MICTCRKPDLPCAKCVKEAEENLRRQYLSHPEVDDGDNRLDPDVDGGACIDPLLNEGGGLNYLK